MSETAKDTRSRTAAAKSVADACRRMNDLGINQGKAGNVSVRFGSGMLISPSGVAYDDLTPAKIVLMDEHGEAEGTWQPSSEWRMHHDIYRTREDAGAIVHTHSINCTALACLNQDIPPFHYMVALAGGPDIRCASYATFGTQKLSDNMLAALEGRTACLLANHGMICFAADIEKALALAVEVETLAAQYLAALSAGAPVLLGKKQMTKAIQAFRTYGAQPAAKGDRHGP
ncbi:MAG: class II aldolase/adducin family protein [Alphaproteobacteria bacterium]